MTDTPTPIPRRCAIDSRSSVDGRPVRHVWQDINHDMAEWEEWRVPLDDGNRMQRLRSALEAWLDGGFFEGAVGIFGDRFGVDDSDATEMGERVIREWYGKPEAAK